MYYYKQKNHNILSDGYFYRNRKPFFHKGEKIFSWASVCEEHEECWVLWAQTHPKYELETQKGELLSTHCILRRTEHIWRPQPGHFQSNSTSLHLGQRQRAKGASPFPPFAGTSTRACGLLLRPLSPLLGSRHSSLGPWVIGMLILFLKSALNKHWEPSNNSKTMKWMCGQLLCIRRIPSPSSLTLK